MGFFKSLGKSVGNIAKKPLRAGAAMMTFGGSELARKAGINGNMQMAGVAAAGAMLGGGMLLGAGGAGGLLGGAGAAGAAGGAGGAGALASSGGVPLLTKVLMGASVASTVAGYFGKKPNEDYGSWLDQYDDEAKAEIKKLEDNLAQIQKNVELRDQAVSKIVNDFPNIAAQAIEERKRSRQAYGEEIDKVTSLMLDKAANQLSAKYAASGGFNSGAFNEALGKSATDIALAKAEPMARMAREDGLAAEQDQKIGMQLRLAEAEGLRDFQRTMLGQGMQDRFSATQALLQNGQANARFGAQMDYQQRRDRQQDNQQLFGSLGSTLGTMAMMPLYSQMFGGNRAAAVSPTNSVNNVPTSTPQPRISRPSYGSRLNLGGGF